MKIKNHYGIASYTLENDAVEAHITTVGGSHITADFNINGKKVNPYFIAPWWDEGYEDLLGLPDYALRGIFFCFPFGLAEKPAPDGRPVFHGQPAGDQWDFVGVEKTDDSETLTLHMDVTQENCQIEKKVTIKNGHNVLYLSDTIDGAVGKYPVGYHPTLRTPTEPGSAIVKISDGYEAWTSPTHMEDFSKCGYSCLGYDHKIVDETKVPTVYGVDVDVTRHPFIRGFDDIYSYFHKDTNDFEFATLLVPSEGYLYFQIKDPKVFPSSMVWTSNSGRHYAPWNSRVEGCVEISAGCQYFHYGWPATQRSNPIEELGYRTHTVFDGSKQEFKLITGCIAVPADYPGVKTITRKDADTIVIEAVDGSVIETKCSVDFLK